MTRITSFLGLLSLALLVGCGGSGPDQPQAKVDPAKAKNAPAASSTNTPSADDPSGTDNQSGDNLAGGNSAAGNPDLPASLAKHRELLALVGPDHFAVARIDFKALRESKFLSEFLNDPDMVEAIAHSADSGDDEFIAMLLQETDFAFASIGPAKDPAGSGDKPVEVIAQMRFSSEQAVEKFKAKTLTDKIESMQHAGKTYYMNTWSLDPSPFYFDGVDLYTTNNQDLMQQLIEGNLPASSPQFMQKLGKANLGAPILLAGSLGPFKEMGEPIAQEITEGAPVPPEFAQLPGQMDWGVLAIDPDGQTPIDLDIDMETEASAEQLRTIVSGLLQFANLQMGQAATQMELEGSDAENMALAKAILGAIGVQREAMHVDLALQRTPEMDKLPAAISTAIAEAKADAEAVRELNEAVRELNNARNIVLAMHNFKDTYTRFPPTNWTDEFPDSEGKALLSWRVAILPFLEQRGLADQFDMDQPWDSAHNKALIEDGLEVYRTDAAPDPSTTTWKYLPEMPGNIILIGAGKGTAVTWSKPDVFTFDPADPLAALGEVPEGSFVVGYADGRVGKLSAEELEAALKGAEAEAP